MKIFLLVMFSGALGTAARYGVTRGMNALFPDFPWGTWLVNVVGAFLAGFLFVWLKTHCQSFSAFFPLIFLGFLGAFTTFSTFALESSKFFIAMEYGKFIANLLLHNVFGVFFAWLGMILGRMMP